MPVYKARATKTRHMDAQDPAANQSGIELGVVVIGGDKARLHRSIYNFDVSKVSGRTINSAELTRRAGGSADGSGSFAANIRRCTRPTTWTEPGITWDKYDGTNDWTSAGGDMDASIPTPKIYTEPAGPNLTSPITGMVGFVTDAISLRSDIVSIITFLTDEDPPNTDWLSIIEGVYVVAQRPTFVIDHTGRYIGSRLKRGVMRGSMRGHRRGVAA